MAQLIGWLVFAAAVGAAAAVALLVWVRRRYSQDTITGNRWSRPTTRATGVLVRRSPGQRVRVGDVVVASPRPDPAQVEWLSAERDGAEKAQPALGIGSCGSSYEPNPNPAASAAVVIWVPVVVLPGRRSWIHGRGRPSDTNAHACGDGVSASPGEWSIIRRPWSDAVRPLPSHLAPELWKCGSYSAKFGPPRNSR